MLKYEVARGVGVGVGVDTNSWARVCETCHSAPCTVYCRADSAYLCTACDARVHAANQVASRHERVWVCEACERAPAAFLCKADAASLCAACDADIHSANPLARRHIRVPVMPVSGSFYGPGPRMGSESSDGFLAQPKGEGEGDEDEDESASWLLLDKNNSSSINQEEEEEEENIGNEFIIQGEVDQYLDLCDYNSGGENNYCHEQSELSVPEKNGDSVVPVQCGEVKEHHYQNFLFGMECEAKSVMQCETKSGHIYTANSFHNVSVSSLDVGVVPEYSTSDLSLSHPRPAKGTIDLFSNPAVQMPTQLSPLDREARVMRYREKKKTRKFEKTIRYASRKAYAETRPRIKGRFAKRSDVEAEMDQIFPTSHIPETGYGIVPSF